MRSVAILVAGYVLAIGISLTGLAAGAQPPGPGGAARQVPAFVADAALGTVEQFAQALAAARLPAGVVLREKDLQEPPKRVFDFLAQQQPLIAFEIASHQFLTARPDYEFRSDGSVLLFRPKDAGACESTLSKRIGSVQMTGTVLEVFDALEKAVNPKIPNVPPGVVSGGGSGPRSSLFRTKIAVDLTNVSLVEAFFEVVRRVPGIVWGLREETDPWTAERKCFLQFYEESSKVTSGWDLR